MLLAHAGDWTAPNVIQSIAAAATFLLAVAAFLTLKASNRVAKETGTLATETKNVAKATQELAIATGRSVDLAGTELELLTKQIDIGERQVKVTLSAMQATVKPILVSDPDRLPNVSFNAQANRTVVQFPVRNIGPGPAFIQDALIEWAPQGKARSVSWNLVAAPRESAIVLFWIGQSSPEAKPNWLRVEVRYTDLVGGQDSKSELYAEFADGAYTVKRLTIFERLSEKTGYREVLKSEV